MKRLAGLMGLTPHDAVHWMPHPHVPLIAEPPPAVLVQPEGLPAEVSSLEKERWCL